MSPEQPVSRMPLTVGIKGTIEAEVRREWTRAFYEPQFPAIFSTPAMIALMEGAMSKAVAPALEEGTFTVGTRVEVEHLKAIPIGAHIEISAQIAQIDGRKLIGDVEARSQGEVIGRGRITQVIVRLEKFARIASGEVSSDRK